MQATENTESDMVSQPFVYHLNGEYSSRYKLLFRFCDHSVHCGQLLFYV